MQHYPYTPALIAEIRRALSEPRFQTYLALASGNAELAMRQYVWNAALASGLQTPLHLLEVTLRNAVNDRLKRAHGANWLDTAGLLNARDRCGDRGQELLWRRVGRQQRSIRSWPN